MDGSRVHSAEDWLLGANAADLGQVDGARCEGGTTSERERIKELENRELRRVNDVFALRQLLFAQAELYRKLKS